MKTDTIQYIFKTLLIIYLFGSSYAIQTSFGLLKKSNKKYSSNTNAHNLYTIKKHQSTDLDNTAQNGSGTAEPVPPANNAAGLVDPSTNNPDGNTQTKMATLPDQPTYYQGWIKYLHYSDADKQSQLSKKFWKNTSYQNQLNVPATTPEAADEVFLYLNLCTYNLHIEQKKSFNFF